METMLKAMDEAAERAAARYVADIRGVYRRDKRETLRQFLGHCEGDLIAALDQKIARLKREPVSMAQQKELIYLTVIRDEERIFGETRA
jgi:hypothetical protein